MPSTIIVGIDFGTTFSGAAWAVSKRPEDIQVITNWESETNGCSDRGKCPTQLQYGDIDHETPWGYNVPTDKDLVRWFKLLLLDEADLPSAVVENPQFKEVREQQGRLRTSPIELVACFLRSLWKHCMENITRALGSGEVASCRFHIVMTVPAIWPHYVQARMKSAADLAGMLQARGTNSARRAPTLEFLSEPEAAALAALAEMHPRPDIKGDVLDGASPSTHEYQQLLTADSSLDIQVTLWFCTSDCLPSRKTDSVKKLCSIKWNKRVDLRELEMGYNSAGQIYYRLKYEIQVIVNGPELRIEVYHNKRKVAAGQVMVEWR
ncbi:Heat shock protein 12A [Beauveria bassiana]|nr:Heat shock protein 12A [Beauveria bassiana]